MCCEISIAEGRLRFNLVRKYRSAIAELRCASTESKSSLRKLRYALESKKIKLRILRCAFAGWKDRCALLRCAFNIMLFVPTSVNNSNCYVVSAAEGIEPGLVCLVESGIAALCIAAYTWRFISQFQPVCYFPCLSQFAQMQICFLSARRFASLLLTFSRFSLIIFLTVVLATATIFLLSFRTWNNFSYWILLSQLAGKTISVRIALIYCFCSSYVCHWFRYYC